MSATSCGPGGEPPSIPADVKAIGIPVVVGGAPQPLTTTERLRRVVILCTNFHQYLACYRAVVRLRPEGKAHDQFVIVTANLNYDACVLEWTKLMGDPKGAHHWKNVVIDPDAFEAGLLTHLKVDAATFENYRKALRFYRDKFVAHLDDHRRLQLSDLDVAAASVDYYFQHVALKEASSGDLRGWPSNADEMLSCRNTWESRATNAVRHLIEDAG